MEDRISSALGEWVANIAKSVLPKVRIPQGSMVGRFMMLIGADPAKYNPWDELGFLVEPITDTFIFPIVNKMFSGMTEEQKEETMLKFVDAMLKKSKEGGVNVFGLVLGEDAFLGLKDLIQRRNDTGRDEGEV